eukprot:GHVP01059740.1.p1 GENE.GHVP01059740.1~~GHVP01059740.1.p1  ORF type:complete len:297 (-),score=38.40 GHVP01059740.1:154-1044(-)
MPRPQTLRLNFINLQRQADEDPGGIMEAGLSQTQILLDNADPGYRAITIFRMLFTGFVLVCASLLFAIMKLSFAIENKKSTDLSEPCVYNLQYWCSLTFYCVLSKYFIWICIDAAFLKTSVENFLRLARVGRISLNFLDAFGLVLLLWGFKLLWIDSTCPCQAHIWAVGIWWIFFIGEIMLPCLSVIMRLLCFSLLIGLMVRLRVPEEHQSPTSPTVRASFERMTWLPTSQAAGGAISCSICMADYDAGDKLVILPCTGRHKFHEACVDQWLQRSRLCPNCRSSVDGREDNGRTQV